MRTKAILTAALIGLLAVLPGHAFAQAKAIILAKGAMQCVF